VTSFKPSRFSLIGTGENHKSFQVGRSLGRHLNTGTLEYKAGVRYVLILAMPSTQCLLCIPVACNEKRKTFPEECMLQSLAGVAT
jgi:hypothetical protein